MSIWFCTKNNTILIIVTYSPKAFLNRLENVVCTDSRLQYLIELADDETAEVREEVLRYLSNYGYTLEEDLIEFSSHLNKEKLKLFLPILEKNRRDWLVENWGYVCKTGCDNRNLEKALNLIAKFQMGMEQSPNLHQILDRLAVEFRQKYPYGNEMDLSYFLFQEKQIKGNKEDFYNPLNSNPIYAVQNQKGLPITLSLLMIFIGDRLEFEITGCNFPGHFMAKFYMQKELIIVDCFNDGRFIYENEIEDLSYASSDSLMHIAKSFTPGNLILRRICNNLVTAYTKRENKINADLFRQLIERLPVY